MAAAAAYTWLDTTPGIDAPANFHISFITPHFDGPQHTNFFFVCQK
jgi:hypothetical protein